MRKKHWKVITILNYTAAPMELVTATLLEWLTGYEPKLADVFLISIRNLKIKFLDNSTFAIVRKVYIYTFLLICIWIQYNIIHWSNTLLQAIHKFWCSHRKSYSILSLYKIVGKSIMIMLLRKYKNMEN